MTAELKFDRARWEAGEMPRLRDGRRVYDIEWHDVGYFKGSAEGIPHGAWCGNGQVFKYIPQSEDLVHDPLPMPADPPGIYMVSVDGRDAPQCEHPSLASAMREAERLSKCGARNKIRVLRVERVYVPTVRTDWGWHVPAPIDDVPF